MSLIKLFCKDIIQTSFKSQVEESMSEKFPEILRTNLVKQSQQIRDESERKLITELELRGLEDGASILVMEDAKFTPLALDIVKEKKIEVIRRKRGARVSGSIAIGSDHGGFDYKERLKSYLLDRGFKVYDFGTNSKDPVDYPDFAHAVGKAVSDGVADFGILIDGAGIGSAVAANKIPGVRAAACYNVALAKNSREHNGANVLTLGSSQNTFEEIIQIVDAFLSSDLIEERHKKRVSKIEGIERQYLNKI